MSLGRRSVETLGVFFHHPVGVEDRRDAADRFAHQLEPGERQFAIGLRVVERDDLVLEQLIKAAGVDFALELDGPILDFRADRPAVVAVVAFAPPAIEHAQIQPAVRRQFHSARAAGFQRTQRIVQPKIDALNQAARNVGIVIFDEDDAVFETGFRG